MRPSAVCTRDGYFAASHERFDPFWARVNEAGIVVVAHVGANGYTANGYGGNAALAALGGGRKPSVAGLISERAIYDFLLTLAYDKLFERFPNLSYREGAAGRRGVGLIDLIKWVIAHAVWRRSSNYSTVGG